MGLAGIFMSVTIGAIFGIGIAIPLVKSIVSNGNLTGIDATLAGFVSTLIVALLVYSLGSQMA